MPEVSGASSCNLDKEDRVPEVSGASSYDLDVDGEKLVQISGVYPWEKSQSEAVVCC